MIKRDGQVVSICCNECGKCITISAPGGILADDPSVRQGDDTSHLCSSCRSRCKECGHSLAAHRNRVPQALEIERMALSSGSHDALQRARNEVGYMLTEAILGWDLQPSGCPEAVVPMAAIVQRLAERMAR